jgi:hypothetical protein
MFAKKVRAAMQGLIKTIAAAAMAMLVAAGPAGAQNPSPEAMAAAKELVVVSRAADSFKAFLPLIAQQLKPAIVQGRPEVERDYDKVMPIMTEVALKQLDKLTDEIAVIYARTFSADEMRQVAAFYRTPVGQRFLDKVPDILQQSMALGQKFGEALVKEIQQTLIDELRKRGHKL